MLEGRRSWAQPVEEGEGGREKAKYPEVGESSAGAVWAVLEFWNNTYTQRQRVFTLTIHSGLGKKCQGPRTRVRDIGRSLKIEIAINA